MDDMKYFMIMEMKRYLIFYSNGLIKEIKIINYYFKNQIMSNYLY